MQVVAFLKLIRWQNLIIVGLTQFFASICLLNWPVFEIIFDFQLLLTILSTILITAGGYIINDYLDVNIDQINKPERVIVGETISRKSAIKLHIFINLLAFIMAGWVSKYLLLVDITTAILLVKYSSSFKKQFLSGNLLISILCGSILPILIFWKNAFPLKWLMIYGIFAGLITLIREIVKDMEDIKGDRMKNCKTLPIVLGISQSKKIIYILSGVLITFSIVISIYSNRISNINASHYLYFIVYMILLIAMPLLFMIYKLRDSVMKDEYSIISRMLKFAMITGILSMYFIR